MTTDSGIRLLIVEDNPLLRENLRLLLAGEPGLQVLAAYETAEEALREIDRLQPQMLLSDLNLPGLSGVDLIREVRQRYPNIEILAHTVNEDRASVFAALKAGADGYILKGGRPSALIEALHTLREGGAPMSPKIARAVVREFQTDIAEEDLLLSAKEKEVLNGVQEGLSYKEIAQRMHISPHTVHSHIKKIYEKLQAKDKQEALSKARRRGLI